MTNTAVHVLTGPLCKLWEHRFSVPGLASIPPPCVEPIWGVQRPFLQSCRMPVSHVFTPVTNTKTWTSENLSRPVFTERAEVNYSLESWKNIWIGEVGRLGTIQRLAQKIHGWARLRDNNGMYITFSSQTERIFAFGWVKQREKQQINVYCL